MLLLSMTSCNVLYGFDKQHRKCPRLTVLLPVLPETCAASFFGGAPFVANSSTKAEKRFEVNITNFCSSFPSYVVSTDVTNISVNINLAGRCRIEETKWIERFSLSMFLKR